MTPAEDDTVAQFAADLRALRLGVNSPTLRRLEHDTGISKSVLSEAFNGRHLPSLRTTARIAQACNADPGAWVQRRDALVITLSRQGVPLDAVLTPTVSTPVSAELGRTHVLRRSTVVMFAIATVVLSVVLSIGLSTVFAHQVLTGAHAGAPTLHSTVIDARAPLPA
ncbi:helix-turn-helix domain-containing protein [Microbacterium sp.]|uniref:helix-turn-helix domain-containing protein n=1 Tax=Microbacterium sp. TaxID=51671 RepID=UPI003F97DB29